MGPPERRRLFEEIYEAHYSDLLTYVWRRTGSPDDAADAIAETFTTAWRRIDELPEGREARLWLYGVARRVLANQRRGASRRTALATRLRAELTAWQDPAPTPGHDRDAVRRAFRLLGERDRELLALVGWEGLDTAEIATLLGCSRGAVRLRLHRARRRLARNLKLVGSDLATYGLRATEPAKGTS